MLRPAFLFVIALCLLTRLGGPAQAEKRIALVIGNSAYQHAGELANPRNDAEDVAAQLTRHGFEVIKGIDLTKAQMDVKIKDFANKLTGADAGLFFYAGHGLQVGGANYLVPIDAALSTSAALDFEMVRLDLVQRTMERETKTNILFLDACRDNPLARNLARAMGTRSQSIGRGLAAIESGAGTMIGFSTQPGNVAQDGDGRNSPYAAALVRQLNASKDDISTMMIGVRNEVMSATKERQVPWEHSALRARFYFGSRPEAPAGGAGGPASIVGPGAPSPFEQQADNAYWDAVRDAKDPAVVQSYLDQFPRGRFVPLARALVARLEQEREQRRIAEKREADRLRAEAERANLAAKEAEQRRKAVEADRAERLQRAAEEERQAQAALERAKAARLAAELGGSAAGAAQGQQLAALAPSATAVPPAEIDRTDLARSIQYQLRRVGCDPGSVDGQWGRQARAALEEFTRYAKVRLQTDEPTVEARDAIAGRKARVCPLECDDDEVEKDGRCVPEAKPRKAAPTQRRETSRESTRSSETRQRPAQKPAAEAKPSGGGGMCWSPTGREGLRPCEELGARGSRAY